MSDGNKEYDEKQLQHLSDLEHVRERPSMYIGDTGDRGLHHLVSEVVDNSIDEAMAGHAKNVNVMVNSDGSLTVEDDGRGIPVGKHEQLSLEMDREVSTLEGVMTVLKFGGKFTKDAYQTSGGLHGVGVTVVNFLSQWCAVQVARDGHVYEQEYERGVPTTAVTQLGKTKKVGTKTTFKPDSQIFSTTKFIYDRLYKRLQELAFLNRGVRIKFHDDRNGEGDEFCYERGIIEFVEYLNRASDVMHPEVIYLSGEQEGVGYEVAVQYSSELTENLHSYVNNIHTIEGGTHVSGFRSALTRSLNNYGRSSNMFPKDSVPTGEDFREGLTAVISVRVPHPQFEGQTKTKLGNKEVDSILTSALGEFLNKYLEENPKSAKQIIRKGIQAMEAREAAKKARDLVRKKSSLTGGGLPGKLRDCRSKNRDVCELYLVEGDSAGGSAEGARDSDFQAILPLRGKIINAYKSREDKVLANEEVQSMIFALRCGIGDDQDLSKLRYGKVIIMTDADVDGSHIRTLLLCFFYRQMYELVQKGHVYIADPPLFRVVKGKGKNPETYYVQTDQEMRRQLTEKGLTGASLDAGTGELIEGERMKKLSKILADMEEALLDLERRGIPLKIHAERSDDNGQLPRFHVFVDEVDHWFHTKAAYDEFLNQQRAEGKRLRIMGEEEEDDEEGRTLAEDAAVADVAIIELLEIRTINQGLKDLAEFGFDIQSLIEQERTGVEEPRYVFLRGESRVPMEDLREVPPAIREAGQKGLQITRFKGLGEMDAEELRDTTLDKSNRTLMQVTMADAGAADEMFRVLMGEKVEPRRQYIAKHAADVKNLDV